MPEALEIERKIRGDVLFMKLKGKITEDSNVDVIKEEPKKNVVIDLEGVDRINSYGIRQWINALKELSQNVSTIVFVRCPPPMVEQFNMISNFGGGGMVYSFYLPFYCEACDRDVLKLYELPEGKTPHERKPLAEEKCSSCGNSLVLNDIEEEYFYFLQYQKGRAVEASLLKEIREASPS